MRITRPEAELEAAMESLSEREDLIVHLIAEGWELEEITEDLRIPKYSVQYAIREIKKKLRVTTNIEIVIIHWKVLRFRTKKRRGM